MKKWIKTWEVGLIILILYVMASHAFFLYVYFYKIGVRIKWEQDVNTSFNRMVKSQKEIVSIVDFNLKHGKLVTPPEEKK